MNSTQKHTYAFLKRSGLVFIAFLILLALSHIYHLAQYGYSVGGKTHHGFLDYPNEIASSDAIRLSQFMESLNTMWQLDEKIKTPFDKEAERHQRPYWAKEIDVKDLYNRHQVIQTIAQEVLGILPTSSLVVPPPHPSKKETDHSAGIPKLNHKIVNPPEEFKIKRPLRPHHLASPECSHLPFEKQKLLSFSPKEFKTLHLKLDGLFSDGGIVNLQSSPETDHVRIQLKLFAQREELFGHVLLSEDNHTSSKFKTVHINHHHPSILKSCMIYHLDIIFPSNLATYEDLSIKVNHANRVEGDLGNTVFNKFSLGLGRGAIHLKDIKAKELMLGNLNGMILGTYHPLNTFGAATMIGATRVELIPLSQNVKSTVVALDGPVKAMVTLPDRKSSIGYTAHCWLCDPEIVPLHRSKDLHLTSSKRSTIKMGHFGELRGQGYINVHSRYGESKLVIDTLQERNQSGV
ncbi:hypothetical protein BD560DRAFT_380161 [Blakeslea trispora]|nr:hypothetical protein BD560DRAFT_380161 [Blakeslea trispora]